MSINISVAYSPFYLSGVWNSSLTPALPIPLCVLCFAASRLYFSDGWRLMEQSNGHRRLRRNGHHGQENGDTSELSVGDDLDPWTAWAYKPRTISMLLVGACFLMWEFCQILECLYGYCLSFANYTSLCLWPVVQFVFRRIKLTVDGKLNVRFNFHVFQPGWIVCVLSLPLWLLFSYLISVS